MSQPFTVSPGTSKTPQTIIFNDTNYSHSLKNSKGPFTEQIYKKRFSCLWGILVQGGVYERAPVIPSSCSNPESILMFIILIIIF